MPYTIPDNITWKNLDAGVVLLNLDSGAYYTLNETASHIWRDLLEGRDEAVIIEGLAQAYDADAQTLGADVREQLQFFVDEGLIDAGGPDT